MRTVEGRHIFAAEGGSHERRRYVHSGQRSDRFRAGHCQVSGRNHKGPRRLAKTEKIIMGNHQNFIDRLLQVERDGGGGWGGVG